MIRRRLQHLLPDLPIVIGREIDGEHAGIDPSRSYHPHRHLLVVGRKSDGANPPIGFGLSKRLHRPSRSENRIHFVHGGKGMELIQVQIFRCQRVERMVQIDFRVDGRSIHGLGGEEDAGAVGTEGRPEAGLGDSVAVFGGHVEVGYGEGFDGVADGAVGEGLLGRGVGVDGEGEGGESEDGEGDGRGGG